jgi:type I restriction enzyme M protein
MKHQEISSLIWNICDDVLRGLFKQHEYGDVILPFVVLRRLDCIVEPHKDDIISTYNELKNDIDEYFEKEVKPHLPNSWVDKDKTQVGYEINFTKYFYKYNPLRSVQNVLKDLLELEKESDGLMNELVK